MFHNLDQLRLQFERENLHEVNAKNCLEVHQCWQQDFKDYMYCEPETYRRDLLKNLDILEDFIDKSVIKYGELRMKENEVNALKETEKLLNEAIPHEHKNDKSFNVHSENALSKSVNETQMQMQEGKVGLCKALDAELVVIDSSGTKSDNQDTSSRSGNYSTHAVDADIRPVNDQEPFAEVDSNTTPDSTNMCNKGGEIDQNAEKCQVTSEQSYQSLEFGNISLKKTVVQFQKDFQEWKHNVLIWNLNIKIKL
ncbi:hypothetical protein Tco_0123475 [Tanacetum coccineum]